jgi:hypothetical protein
LAEKSHAQQVPVFERKISVEMENETIEAILTEISRQSQVSFSYNPELLNASDKKSLSLPTNRSLRPVEPFRWKSKLSGTWQIYYPSTQERKFPVGC